MELHIGQEIKKVCKSSRIGATEFAALVSMTAPNVHKIWKKSSIDTELLVKISKALEFDFFALYTKQLQEESEGIKHAQYVKGLHSAAGITPESVELEKCKSDREHLADKYRVQTENASNLQKYVKLLEEKIANKEHKVK